MHFIHIITDQTDDNGDTLIHTVKAKSADLPTFTASLNAGGDYANIMDCYGTVHYVRRMDIHAVEIEPA